MPDGQIFSRTILSALHGRAASGQGLNAAPVSVAAYRRANERLLARNAILQSGLEFQRARAAELRSILCSMDVATLCICPALKLRLFTAAAGRLLGISQEDVGIPFSPSAPFDLQGSLLARIKATFASGIADSRPVALASGQQILCRLLPLHAAKGAAPAIGGVIITFSTPGLDRIEAPVKGMPVTAAPDRRLTAPPDGGPAAGQAELAHGLTRRQHQVLGHVLAGQPSKNIAADLGISRRTVENHRAAIMARMGATSLPALVRLAIGADVGGDCRPDHARRVWD